MQYTHTHTHRYIQMYEKCYCVQKLSYKDGTVEQLTNHGGRYTTIPKQVKAI